MRRRNWTVTGLLVLFAVAYVVGRVHRAEAAGNCSPVWKDCTSGMATAIGGLTGDTSKVSTTDTRLSDARQPTGNITVGPNLSLSGGTATATATSTGLNSTPKINILGDGNSAHYLDGSGAWSTPAGGGGGGSLTTNYSVDFTTLGAADLLGGGTDGSRTIDGKTWTVRNANRLQTFYLNDGTHSGLYLRHTTYSSDNWTTYLTGPALYAPLANLATSLGAVTYSEVWLWYNFEQPHTPNANYETAYLAAMDFDQVDYSYTHLNRWGLYRSYAGSAFANLEACLKGTEQYGNGFIAAPDVAVVRVGPGNQVTVWGGNMASGAWPDPSTLTFLGIVSRWSGNQPFQFNYLNTWIALSTSNGNGASDVLLKKLRIQSR